MSKLPVRIDYIKIAQWTKMIRHFQQKISNELDRAARDCNIDIPERRVGDRGNIINKGE